jgi:hypothetical protein
MFGKGKFKVKFTNFKFKRKRVALHRKSEMRLNVFFRAYFFKKKPCFVEFTIWEVLS